MARGLVNILEEKIAEDILLLDIHEITDFTDYFIIASGTSDRMLDSLADAGLEKGKQLFGVKGRKNGEPSDGWMVIDFGDVVVHLFSPDQREYYQLEQLWDKGKVLLRMP